MLVTKPRTRSSPRIRSVVAPVIALIGFIVMLPHSLYQTSRWICADTVASKPASRQQSRERRRRAALGRARRLADDQPVAHVVPDHARRIGAAARVHHAADRRASPGIAAAIAPSGSTDCEPRAGEAPPRPSQEPPRHAVHRGQHDGVRAQQRRDLRGHRRHRGRLDRDHDEVLRRRAPPARRWRRTGTACVDVAFDQRRPCCAQRVERRAARDHARARSPPARASRRSSRRSRRRRRCRLSWFSRSVLVGVVDAVDLAHQRVEHVLPGAVTRVELQRVARAASRDVFGHRDRARPSQNVASWISQARCSVHSIAKACGSVWPHASRPWLRRITAWRSPMLFEQARAFVGMDGDALEVVVRHHVVQLRGVEVGLLQAALRGRPPPRRPWCACASRSARRASRRGSRRAR